jgi:hypothetical protein
LRLNMNRKRAKTRWLVPGLLMLSAWLFQGCAGRPMLVSQQTCADALPDIMARRAGFTGFTTEGNIAATRQGESYTLPFSLTVSSALRVEVKGEISHFLLPFSGEFRLVSDEEATLLYTDMGVFELTQDAAAQAALRAFLLSLAGGGDWLVWWLADNGCEPAQESTCGGVKIELEPESDVPAIRRWTLTDTSGGSTFRAEIERRKPGTLLVKTLRGTLYPEEIAIVVTYE